MIDKTFGRLLVKSRAENDKNRNSRWLCQCSCGNFITVLALSLRNGDTRSCGCLKVGRAIGKAINKTNECEKNIDKTNPTKENVYKIRMLYTNRIFPQETLATLFGVSRKTISNIVKYKGFYSKSMDDKTLKLIEAELQKQASK